mmetsp:Transcript_5147/g.10477  ORF Transcript_5147/g.10477 Transcript_5147/m.10477 type:complete len:314 (-) Transcript_5147:267-1208(-)|eukprot:CAMPEP_0184684604 /NCGR_PEP_ID=MMETSP0312-20130426/15925_1 /TAXON_ID=31354 /ORGANISM="Compsopogon coeruleus, Strain SAG 36.94" /LENGTH=313 /DNA_ID=CAMNT_0027137943 /DNA_START=74 /DNA_END=1015 /DNA_ORIENTATION=-
MAPSIPQSVAVHPLVLLSVVDHYNRVCRDTKKRAVGALLGSVEKGRVNCTNSFAIPFEEDEREPSVWFLDHNFVENMLGMCRKVNAREVVVGWYSTGPEIRAGDPDINELMRSFTEKPVLVIIDVKPKDLGLPTEAYFAVEEPKENGKVQRSFQHLPSEINASDAEEVGVGHLLRDIKDSGVSTLSGNIQSKVAALRSLLSRLRQLEVYLKLVADGTLPVNNEIFFNMQDIFTLLPSFDAEQVVKSFAVKTNDMTLVLYLSSLIRCIVALHNLIDNKLALRQAEKHRAEESRLTDSTEEGNTASPPKPRFPFV